MSFKSFAFTSSNNCFHNTNAMSHRRFQHSLSAATIKWCLQSQSATNTCSSAIIWEVCCIKWLVCIFVWLVWILRYFQTFLCSLTEALCNRTLELQAGRRGRRIKTVSVPNHFSPHWEQILIGNDVCVNLTRAPSTVARPAGTHCENAWKTVGGGGGLEMDQDTERNAEVGKWMST